MLFAKLLAINNPHFDFEGSNFSAKNMSAKDRYLCVLRRGDKVKAVHVYALNC